MEQCNVSIDRVVEQVVEQAADAAAQMADLAVKRVINSHKNATNKRIKSAIAKRFALLSESLKEEHPGIVTVITSCLDDFEELSDMSEDAKIKNKCLNQSLQKTNRRSRDKDPAHRSSIQQESQKICLDNQTTTDDEKTLIAEFSMEYSHLLPKNLENISEIEFESLLEETNFDIYEARGLFQKHFYNHLSIDDFQMQSNDNNNPPTPSNTQMFSPKSALCKKLDHRKFLPKNLLNTLNDTTITNIPTTHIQQHAHNTTSVTKNETHKTRICIFGHLNINNKNNDWIIIETWHYKISLTFSA